MNKGLSLIRERMKKEFEDFARKQLKEYFLILELRDPGCSVTFKRMYSPKNLNASISEVIDSLPEDKLDWATTQVENTLEKYKT